MALNYVIKITIYNYYAFLKMKGIIYIDKLSSKKEMLYEPK